MITGDLAKHIETLVDHLRKNKDDNLSLIDVASVTEVLIGTMSAYFRSIDTKIYRECRSLSDYIENARAEIAALQPGDLESERIPRAGLELDAIVQHTEEATNTIMEAAEEIMGLDPADPDAYVTQSQEAVMRIFEACSFQDITGQRISKVVQTLEHIETRVLELKTLLGISDDEVADAHAKERSAAAPTPADQELLRGPALQGEGIDQSAVDSLMADSEEAEATEEAAAPTPELKPEPKAEAKPAPKPASPPPPPPPEPPKPVHPKVLDNMFEEDFDPMEETEAEKAKEKAADEAEAAKAKKAKPAAEPKKQSAPESDPAEAELGEEVSQDDIDALFG